MLRRLFTIASGLSLALCAMTCLLWVRSAHVYDYFIRASGGRCIIMDTSRDGSVRVREYDGWPAIEPLHWWHGDPGTVGYNIGESVGSPAYWTYVGPDGRPLLKGYDSDMVRERVVMTARELYWLSFFNWLSLTLLLPLAWIAMRIHGWFAARARDRWRLCKRCGYDLRATPDRCPECGAVSGGKISS